VTAWPAHPVVHEVFAWVWLDELSRRHGRRITLGDVPAEAWDEVARPGIDAVWLMGVWERSPAAAAIARSDPSMRAAAAEALPNLDDRDVVGSAYAVRRYAVDPALGGDAGLARARAELAARGVRLVLDLVPNHVAPDHPWVDEHPEYFVRGTADDLAAHPDAWVEIGGRVLARGRDPYFPAWPDVVQLDTSTPEVRAAMLDEVLSIAARCDGIRCDMAMLLLDDVFARTWGARARGGPSPDGGRGFWPSIIGPVKAAHPDLVLWAEAYWDLEPVLVEQGFDACYDKRLYDRLVHGEPVDSIRAHLAADPGYQRHLVRFVENHDEARAASVLGPARLRAALVTTLTLPGVALLHEGGPDGRRVRVPVILGRRPVEPTDGALSAFVARLLDVLADGLRRGTWAMAPVEGWPDNPSADRLLAWTWTTPNRRVVVVVNLSDARADGRVRLPWADLDAATTVLVDRISGERYERDTSTMLDEGLYVALADHGVHLLEVSAPRPS
jgi:glycosidase